MTSLVLVCATLLAVGATLAVVRAEKGPSMLDRAIALDVVVAVLVAAIALESAVTRSAVAVPILVVLSIVGFLSSVTIARFAAVEPAGEGRVLSRAEAAAAEAERRAREVADDEAEGRDGVDQAEREDPGEES
ncbi:putative monovalent cation/H+ antiporter subunit F [mine drainage metagenome]|uniref:Putative monovalent cation/H+ antiporter subunit F n=1 Tax=mine drainage metagenome TaxID=410659 RepID=A0A1J5QN97_9ZZZZ